MGVRRIRKDRIAADQKVSRKENGILKVKERARRDARMLGIVKAKKLPYLPAVMSWLSASSTSRAGSSPRRKSINSSPRYRDSINSSRLVATRSGARTGPHPGRCPQLRLARG